ncbi:FkbM family methyltransferase [Azospirillum fermentarium]|uniref:FkbM family methyltransferase n=1 Tax=Azospirillum fermentarium TaxID=1233114 RepID=UPI002226A6A0|nr:FkbM family methyltransferase [Azospirillum fermentarium]MCW2246962.1 FkbM family methyltransferase [Azospirillum fermentarium]
MTQPSPTATTIPTIQGNLGQILGYLSQNLKNFPRRVPGRLVIDGRELRYVDLHSFYWQALQIFHSRLYDIRTTETAPLIVDCGAHIGLASLYFASRFPQATIHAFEADPAIAEVMAANLLAQGIMQVTPYAKAVWTHGDGITFADTHDDSGHVVSGGPAEGKRVESIRLRDFLAGLGRPVDLLKLDIEGAEFAVADDCDGALGGVRRIIAEVHCMDHADGTLASFVSVLERNGFRTVMHDLHLADWLGTDNPPPFTALPTHQYIITVFAWR